MMKSKEREMAILRVLDVAEIYEGPQYFGFDALAKRTGIERRQVRIDTRRMARKGLTQYGKGLWNDDGEPCGAGYAITAAGRTLVPGEP